MSILRRFFRGKSGGPAVEMALLFPVILFVTLGIIEFGYALFQWNRAEKALQLGARLAVTWDPIAADLTSFDGKANTNTFGDACTDPVTGVVQPACIYDPNPIVCTSAGCNGYGFSAAAFNAIVDEMQVIFDWIRPENVVVEYAATGLGFVGRPGNNADEFNLVPAVTVRLQNMTFNFLVIDDLFGFAAIDMPRFATTLIGEDLSTNTS
jgi:Flp pilus assembly pilin Flp